MTVARHSADGEILAIRQKDSGGQAWSASAPAWIDHVNAGGDPGRIHVLDAPMIAHARATGAKTALDVGCGEGRFCRMLAATGIVTTGLDPVPTLLDHARAAQPGGTFVEGVAEAMPFDDAAFDLVVSYVSMVDIPDFRAAISEMARVLAPGGTILIANLCPHVTAIASDTREDDDRWAKRDDGESTFAMDNYLKEFDYFVAWGAIRLRCHHRPLAAYMTALLDAGLTLTRFEEPPYTGPDRAAAARYARVPWFNLMAWHKPA